MNEAEVTVGGVVVAGRQPPGVLEFVEAAFNHVAQGIDEPVSSRLNDCRQRTKMGSAKRPTADTEPTGRTKTLHFAGARCLWL